MTGERGKPEHLVTSDHGNSIFQRAYDPRVDVTW
jgi:hypothetical protein